MQRFFAHSGAKPDGSDWQLLKSHLQQVAALTRSRMANLPRCWREMRDVAHWAGLLHDVGKYRPEFQEMLKGLRKKGKLTRHKQAGAAWAYDAKLVDVAFAIAGHHGGIPDNAEFRSEIVCEPGSRDVAANVRRVAVTDLPELANPMPPPLPVTDALELDLRVRMLFSCLVDADWTDTSRHERMVKQLDPLPEPARLTRDLAHTLLQRVLGYIELRATACHAAEQAAGEHATTTAADVHVSTIRAQILSAARRHTRLSPGLFSMTVPTGGGKTLVSLAFALEYAFTEFRLFSCSSDDARAQDAVVCARQGGEQSVMEAWTVGHDVSGSRDGGSSERKWAVTAAHKNSKTERLC